MRREQEEKEKRREREKKVRKKETASEREKIKKIGNFTHVSIVCAFLEVNHYRGR
jgi:hypothetical protein